MEFEEKENVALILPGNIPEEIWRHHIIAPLKALHLTILALCLSCRSMRSLIACLTETCNPDQDSPARYLKNRFPLSRLAWYCILMECGSRSQLTWIQKEQLSFGFPASGHLFSIVPYDGNLVGVVSHELKILESRCEPMSRADFIHCWNSLSFGLKLCDHKIRKLQWIECFLRIPTLGFSLRDLSCLLNSGFLFTVIIPHELFELFSEPFIDPISDGVFKARAALCRYIFGNATLGRSIAQRVRAFILSCMPSPVNAATEHCLSAWFLFFYHLYYDDHRRMLEPAYYNLNATDFLSFVDEIELRKRPKGILSWNPIEKKSIEHLCALPEYIICREERGHQKMTEGIAPMERMTRVMARMKLQLEDSVVGQVTQRTGNNVDVYLKAYKL